MRHDLNEWVNEKKTINTDELTRLVAEMFAARTNYDHKKEDSDQAYKNYEEKESLLVKALLAAGLKEFSAPGQKRVSVTTELVPQTPKTVEDKDAFYEFVKKEYGHEYLANIQSINANTVKSIYNKAAKEMQAQGIALPKIPGITQVTEFTKLNRGKKE